MLEKSYLLELEQHLMELNETERQDIVRDFREHFASGRLEGKTIEEMIASLGSAKELANELIKVYSDEDFIQSLEIIPQSKIGYSKVEVRSESASIIIVPSLDDEAQLEIKDKDGHTKANMEIINNTLCIQIKRETSTRKFLFFNFGINGMGDAVVTVKLPKKTYERIFVLNGNGYVKLEDLLANKIDIETNNGRIAATNVSAASMKYKADNGRIVLKQIDSQDVTAVTDNGRIVVERSTSHVFNLTTDNGRIELHEVIGNIRAETDNGRIEAKITEVNAPLDWKTDNGSITLTTEVSLNNVTIEARTNPKHINVYGQSNHQFTFGNGAIPIKFKTDSGRITVQMAE